MSLSFEENPMVWVVVQTVDGVEQFVGQHSADLDIMFIPFFKDKEEAQQGLSLIRRAKGSRYEVQAVHIKDSGRGCRPSRFFVVSNRCGRPGSGQDRSPYAGLTSRFRDV